MLLRGNMHLFSQSLSIVLRCDGQLLNVTFSFTSARCIRWPVFALIKVSCRCVIDLVLLDCVYCERLIRTRIGVCSVSFHLLMYILCLHAWQPLMSINSQKSGYLLVRVSLKTKCIKVMPHSTNSKNHNFATTILKFVLANALYPAGMKAVIPHAQGILLWHNKLG